MTEAIDRPHEKGRRLAFFRGLHTSSEVLREAGLDEREALIEFACRLFQARELTLWPGPGLAGLLRVEMEREPRQRGTGAYAPTVEKPRDDLGSLERIGGMSRGGVASDSLPVSVSAAGVHTRRACQ